MEKTTGIIKIVLAIIVFIAAIAIPGGTSDYNKYQHDMTNHPEWAQFYND